MKLSRAIFRSPRRLPGMREADVEITDEQCPGMRYDQETGAVMLGDIYVPREQVLEWERANDMLVCPECGKEAANASAMGSHRSAKHGVPGMKKGAT